jgi:nitrilase
MIVDPWGTVLARAGYREGVIVADIDLGQAERIRKTLPALQHRRGDLFTA